MNSHLFLISSAIFASIFLLIVLFCVVIYVIKGKKYLLNLKKISYVFSMIMTISIFMSTVLITIFISIEKNKKNKVNVEDVFILKEIQTDNPFNKYSLDTIKIIEIKNNYVLYTNGKDTISSKKSNININYLKK